MGSRSRRARQRLNRRKQSNSTDSSSEGEGEDEGSAMEMSQSDGEPHQKTEQTIESISRRLRVRSHSSSNSETSATKKRDWTEMDGASQPKEEEDENEDEDEEEEVGPDTKQLAQSVVSQFRPKMQASMKTGSTVSTEFELKASLAIQSRGKPPKKRKRIPYTLVEASKGNRCPTPGCNGVGHLTGMYAMHFAVSGCPKAHGKSPEECRARREELNRLRLKAIPPVTSSSSSEANEGCSERSARRVSRVTGGNSPPTAPSSLQSHVRRSSSHVSTLVTGVVYAHAT